MCSVVVVCVCMYVCVCVCVCAYVCACVYMSAYVYMCAYVCKCMRDVCLYELSFWVRVLVGMTMCVEGWRS